MKIFLQPFVLYFFTALIGAYFVNVKSEFYQSLMLPVFVYNRLLFILVWTVIYFFMAIGYYKSKNSLFIVDSIFNMLYGYTLFEIHNIVGAMWINGILIVNILLIIFNVKWGRRCFIFYLLWLIFCFWLTVYIFLPI